MIEESWQQQLVAKKNKEEQQTEVGGIEVKVKETKHTLLSWVDFTALPIKKENIVDRSDLGVECFPKTLICKLLSTNCMKKLAIKSLIA